MGFESKYSFEERKKESARILEKYPDKVPIICEKYSKDKSIYKIDKNKFLAGGDLTMGQFVYVIRKRIKMSSKEGLFLFVNNTLLPNTEQLSKIYKDNKSEDGFLYVQFSLENTFGFK